MYDYRPPADKPALVYQDDHLLLVDKPAGLLSVPGRRPEHRDCLLHRVQRYDPEALLVHRLDMDTSGLLLLARNPQAQRELSRQFASRRIEKFYLAVVRGQLVRQNGEIDLPLGRDWQNRPRQRVDPQQGKPAHTRYRVLSYDPQHDSSRVELQPTTGRTHQLRVHLQALGHPILGDDLYADAQSYRAAERLLLHASRLAFAHPTSGEWLAFELPAPF